MSVFPETDVLQPKATCIEGLEKIQSTTCKVCNVKVYTIEDSRQSLKMLRHEGRRQAESKDEGQLLGSFRDACSDVGK